MAAAADSKNVSSELTNEKTMLFLCDFQEEYKKVAFFKEIVKNGNKLLKEAKNLGVPVVITELRGMGDTVAKLGAEKPAYRPLSRVPLSMIGPDIRDEILRNGVTTIVLCGLELHKAVEVTAKDLRDMGVQVHLVFDASGSEHSADKKASVTFLQSIECKIVSTVDAFKFLNSDQTNVSDHEPQRLYTGSTPAHFSSKQRSALANSKQDQGQSSSLNRRAYQRTLEHNIELADEELGERMKDMLDQE